MLYRGFAVGAPLVVLLVSSIFGPRTSAQIGSWTVDLGFTIKRIPTVVPSPDGTKVAFVVSEALMEGDKSEWLSQLHVANADGSGSVQLTRGDKSATMPRWSPDGKSIGFITSRSGIANVWRIAVNGGEAEQITNEKSGIVLFDWAPDGTSIAFVMPDAKSEREERDVREKRDWRTIDENVKQKRLYLLPVSVDVPQGRIARKLTTSDYSVEDFDWAPDSASIVFRHQPTPSPSDTPRSDISSLRLTDGLFTVIANSGASEEAPRFSPDAKRIAFTSSDNPPTAASTKTVNVVSAAGGMPRPLASTSDNQPSMLGWTADGSRLLITETNRITPGVYALPVAGGSVELFSKIDMYVGVASLNSRRTHIGFTSQAFDKPSEAFVSKASAPFTPVQVSHVQPQINVAVPRTEVVSWKSFDGQPIEGLLTYPVDYEKGSRVPLVVIIHGGPAGVFTRTFIGGAVPFEPYPVAAFAAEGYAVLRVNPRGSSGYGRSFRYGNMRDLGGGDYKDIMTGVDHAIALGVADRSRLGVMGWSYGGYLTAWIVTQTDRFKAASAGAAITNFFSMTGTSDLPNILPDYFEGELWEVHELARSRSPVMNVASVSTPTLLQHGEADVRIPTSQSYEFYNGLKRRGVKTKFTVYPRQNHGFSEPKMTLDAAKANLEWFARHIKGTAAVTGTQ